MMYLINLLASYFSRLWATEYDYDSIGNVRQIIAEVLEWLVDHDGLEICHNGNQMVIAFETELFSLIFEYKELTNSELGEKFTPIAKRILDWGISTL